MANLTHKSSKYLNAINTQIKNLSFRKQNMPITAKRITFSDRFKHEIQKLKIDGNNMYKLILPVDGERDQTKTVECKFLFSYADMEMCPQYQFSLQDMTIFPIIDVFEPQDSPNPQIYHKIHTVQQKRKLMKYYNFTSFTDYQFKSSLYELSLYKTMQNSRLQDYFILFKGNSKQLVMIFDYCYVSLHDMLYYRKMANYEWEQRELLIIMKMLCQHLIELAQSSIVHRDVRPSTIFFSPISIINSGDSNVNLREMAGHLVNQSINCDRFYTFFNLESARIVDRSALLQDDDSDDIFTVKGSPVFTQDVVREALSNGEHKANYNPYQNDIMGLKNTLVSMVNLQPTNVGNTHDERLIKKPKIKTLLKFLSTQYLYIQQVIQQVNDLLGINPVRKSDEYYNVIRSFYIKQLTICQNIETNLYFNNSRQPYFQLASQLPVQANIDSRNRPQQPQNPTFDYIESLYIKTLYDLHKKDKFVSYMLQKLSKNFQTNKKEQNVALLMKVGGYFEQSGVKENQYYKQAVLLLVQLAEVQRLQGFNKDHQRLVNQAEEVYAKFDPQSKMISRAKCMLLKQKAYKQMSATNQPSPQQSLARGLFGVSNNNKAETVQKIIFQAYEQAQKANLPIQEQLELIYAKGQLSFYLQKGEQAETFFFNGYQIAQKNYKEFLTAHNCSKYKGMFEYAMALVEMTKIKLGISPRTPKAVFQIEQKLEKAKQRFSTVQIHPVLVIKCYIALGDLNYIREDGQNAQKNYQRALNLLHAQNEAQGQGVRAISASIQIQIVSKLIDVLNKGNSESEAKKYQSLYEALNKQFKLARKNQRRYSRKGKTSGSRQQRQKKQRPILDSLAPIQQDAEEQNRMMESRTRPLGEFNMPRQGMYESEGIRQQHQLGYNAVIQQSIVRRQQISMRRQSPDRGDRAMYTSQI